jgi:hypothetical protein
LQDKRQLFRLPWHSLPRRARQPVRAGPERFKVFGVVQGVKNGNDLAAGKRKENVNPFLGQGVDENFSTGLFQSFLRLLMLTVKNQSGDSAGQNKHVKYLNSRGESRIIKAPHRRNPIQHIKKGPLLFGSGPFFIFLFEKTKRPLL